MRPAVLALLLVITACARPPAADPAALVTDTIPSADGVSIVYDVRGQGDPALVFIHCWACDRTFWRAQLDSFALSHRVVSLDLAGHGESGVDRAAWSIESLAADVQTVVDTLGLQRVVLIGHSLGGPVALLAAARMPGRVAGVVCADALQDAELTYTRDMMAGFVRSLERDYAGQMTGMVRAMFPETADTSLVRWVTDQAIAANREAVVAVLRDGPSLDLRAAFQAARVPIRCINAAPRPPVGPPTLVERNRQYGDFDAVLMEGVGHYLMLERPGEFNRRLRDVLAALAPPD